MKTVATRYQQAGLNDLDDVRRFIEQQAVAFGVDEDAIGDVVLAANEALTNTLLHGYDGRPGPVEITIRANGPNLEVVLCDTARPFDPTTLPDPDVTLPLEERALGGLGVFMMRRLLDDLRYRRTPEGKNELTLAKRNVVPATTDGGPGQAQLPGPEELAIVKTLGRLRRYPAGETIIREGEPGDRMFVLLDGEIVVSVQGHPIDRLYPGNVLGEMAMVDDRPRSATATAVRDCKVAVIDREGFRQIVIRSPEFAKQVMSIMSVRLRRLMEEEVRRQRLEEELAVGRRIQLTLLPAGCPEVSGWDFAAGYKAAREVGGDLYDFVFEPGNTDRLHVIIADVTGKGVPAALFMAVSRTILRHEALDGRGPAEALERVNQFIGRDERAPLFLSAFYLVLNTATGEMTFANAGHNLPLWLRGTGEVDTLHARGIVLGAFTGLPIEEVVETVSPGDFIVLFTDGITEARNPTGDFFNDEGLEALIRSQQWPSAEALRDAIIDAVERFAGEEPQADDYTVVVIHRSPSA